MAEVDDALANLSTHLAGNAAEPEHQIELLSLAAMEGVVLDFTKRSDRVLVSTMSARAEVGLGTALSEVKTERMAAGAEHRCIYPLDILEVRAGEAFMQHWAEAGEHQRLARQPTTQFLVFDDKLVMLLADFEDTSAPFVIVRHPAVVAAYTELFELMWAAAMPVPTDTERAESVELLELLTRGYKDESIARYLGVGVRTVRRRVADLMSELGVTTRFQLGAEAVRQGRIPLDQKDFTVMATRPQRPQPAAQRG